MKTASGRAGRLAAASLIVTLVAASIWLFGRPEPTVLVVAAAEDWPAAREPGAFVTVELPESAADLFVTAEQLPGRVPAVAVPAGAVVSHALLVDATAAVASDLSAALLAVNVNPSLWPYPGPRAGDAAVLAAEPGGCATAVLPVVMLDDGALVVEARPQLASVLGPTQWWVWESPPAGWPACPPPDPFPQQAGLNQPQTDRQGDLDQGVDVQGDLDQFEGLEHQGQLEEQGGLDHVDGLD